MDKNKSVEILKALADENRLAIVRKIAKDTTPTPGRELSGACAQQLSQPTMSHHVSKLVEAGVLRVEKQGTKKIYSLECDTLDSIGIDITKL